MLVTPLTLLFCPLFQMLFVSKHPSVLPCSLCASKCPPHNVFHAITNYPEYYDPLYFPKCHLSLLENEQSVCAWLLNNLQIHSAVCSSCPPLWQFQRICVLYFGFFFSICVAGFDVWVTQASVELSHFSFCCLHHSLLTSREWLMSTCASDEEWDICAGSVLTEMPTWVVCEKDTYCDSLCTLSASHLSLLCPGD